MGQAGKEKRELCGRGWGVGWGGGVQSLNKHVFFSAGWLWAQHIWSLCRALCHVYRHGRPLILAIVPWCDCGAGGWGIGGMGGRVRENSQHHWHSGLQPTELLGMGPHPGLLVTSFLRNCCLPFADLEGTPWSVPTSVLNVRFGGLGIRVLLPSFPEFLWASYAIWPPA